MEKIKSININSLMARGERKKHKLLNDDRRKKERKDL
jgi:hypothetical protein